MNKRYYPLTLAYKHVCIFLYTDGSNKIVKCLPLPFKGVDACLLVKGIKMKLNNEIATVKPIIVEQKTIEQSDASRSPSKDTTSNKIGISDDLSSITTNEKQANKKNLTFAELNALSALELNKLPANQLKKLNAQQLNKLNTSQLNNLALPQLKQLSANNLGKLNQSQAGKIS